MSSAIRKIIITGLGTGYLPYAPGTWGSAAACLIGAGIVAIAGGQPAATNAALGVFCLVTCVACLSTGRYAQDHFGRKDPGQCVIDEWAGQAVTMAALPYAPDASNWLILVVASFLAFRFFDILKLPPARQMERFPHGWGVLLDDLVAGIQGNIILQLIFRVILRW